MIISVVLVALGTVGIGIASVYHMKYALKSLFNMEFNTGSDFWAYGDISSYNKIGERAVAIARSRLNWSYSQAKRTLEGFWDCSSMVARCYQEAGFDLKAIMGAQWCMTTVGWKDFAMKNKQFIEEADLQPGDVIWYGRPSGNHMMMYAGNGQVIHAKGEKYGTVYEPLANTGYRSARQVYFFRPYLNLFDESTDDSSYDAFLQIRPGMGLIMESSCRYREERFGPAGRYLSREGNGLTWPEAMVDMRMAAISSISGIPWWIF